jgi:S-adenosylmethionine:tRNA ribosyltransferase-isomerase
VAAPTAGLHFTSELISELNALGVETEFITLDVGVGTFRPVTARDIREHVMHAERCVIGEIQAERINKAKSEGRRIIAVGTTVVRTLESFADDMGYLSSGTRDTDIFIKPGYNFKITDAMITNFHLPKSTLLMLVSAFASYDLIMRAYAEAVARRYKFFSFGDAMLIE